ncbi:hypothetical protein GCM10009794_21390 [Rothia terrae]
MVLIGNPAERAYGDESGDTSGYENKHDDSFVSEVINVVQPSG